MKNNAFVFARGGSKGLPGKNIKILSGKPLIQYSIEIALESPAIENIFVSTDDADIAAIAVASGAILIERPAELASDESPEWLSWRHAIEWVNKHYGMFDCFISLPATSPLRSVEDVEAAIRQRIDTEADVCISITPTNHSPFFNMVKQTENQLVELINEPQEKVTRRQDAPEVFNITTVVYAASPQFILQQNGLFSGKVTSIIVPKNRAVDIDDIYDFKLAEVILADKKIIKSVNAK